MDKGVWSHTSTELIITQTEYGILFKNNTRGRTKEQSS